MACNGAYATTYEYATEMCLHGILSGVDDSGGVGNAVLTDSTEDFVSMGIEIGHWARNVTDGSEGRITAVTTSTITASLSGGTTNLWSDGDVYELMPISDEERSIIQMYLDTAASDVHASLAASGACDCSLASWATAYLKKLNIWDAAVRHNCPCGNPNLTQDMREMWLEWVNGQLGLLRTQEVEVCAGETGADFPAMGIAEQSLTDWTAARIVYNDIMRES